VLRVNQHIFVLILSRLIVDDSWQPFEIFDVPPGCLVIILLEATILVNGWRDWQFDKFYCRFHDVVYFLFIPEETPHSEQRFMAVLRQKICGAFEELGLIWSEALLRDLSDRDDDLSCVQSSRLVRSIGWCVSSCIYCSSMILLSRSNDWLVSVLNSLRRRRFFASNVNKLLITLTLQDKSGLKVFLAKLRLGCGLHRRVTLPKTTVQSCLKMVASLTNHCLLSCI